MGQDEVEPSEKKKKIVNTRVLYSSDRVDDQLDICELRHVVLVILNCRSCPKTVVHAKNLLFAVFFV